MGWTTDEAASLLGDDTAHAPALARIAHAETSCYGPFVRLGAIIGAGGDADGSILAYRGRAPGPR